ncbi:MAG: hypothetical protein JRI68_07640 [Deltaproteobacteria bacterium]|nr:hypothetical protein [Deltaproteobacteria bacterium]
MGYRDEAEALRAANATLTAELDEMRARLLELERRDRTGVGRYHVLLGGPTRLVSETELDGELSEEGHEMLVATLRRELGEIGRTERIGNTLAWSTTGRSGRFVEVTCESRKGGTHLRIEEPLRNLLGGLFGGGIGGGGGGGMAFIVPLSLRFPGLLPFLLVGWILLLYLVMRAIFGRIARKRSHQLEALMERLGSNLESELSLGPGAVATTPGVRVQAAADPDLAGDAEAEAEQEAELDSRATTQGTSGVERRSR